MTTGYLLTALKHPHEAQTLGLPTTTNSPEMVLGTLKGDGCWRGRLSVSGCLPASPCIRVGMGKTHLCGYLPTWFGKCYFLLYGVTHLPRQHVSFPPPTLVCFPSHGLGDEVVSFLDFPKWGFPPFLWFVWFGSRGLGESSGSGPALRPCSMSLTQGQAPQVLAFCLRPLQLWICCAFNGQLVETVMVVGKGKTGCENRFYLARLNGFTGKGRSMAKGGSDQEQKPHYRRRRQSEDWSPRGMLRCKHTRVGCTCFGVAYLPAVPEKEPTG